MWIVDYVWAQIVSAPAQSVLSVVALLFSLLSFWETRRRGLAAARFNQTMAFLNEWRIDLKEARHHLNSIGKKLSRDRASWELGYGRQTPEDRAAIEAVSHYFDYLGWTLISGNLDAKLLFTHIGPPIIRHWVMLRQCLYAERMRRGIEGEGESEVAVESEPFAIKGKAPGLYQEGFEHLAQVAYENYGRSYLKVKNATFEVPGYPRRA